MAATLGLWACAQQASLTFSELTGAVVQRCLFLRVLFGTLFSHDKRGGGRACTDVCMYVCGYVCGYVLCWGGALAVLGGCSGCAAGGCTARCCCDAAVCLLWHALRGLSVGSQLLLVALPGG